MTAENSAVLSALYRGGSYSNLCIFSTCWKNNI
nr:MAG TPA: hypothetical protein [Inoviridae sp.]